MPSPERVAELMRAPNYPRTAKYDAQWITENGMGSNPLWYMESLSQVMTLAPGMRVLDMGCGKAISSIFLAKEFGVQVWATDVGNVIGGPDFVRNWGSAVDPTLNWKRICEASVGHLVYPVAAEAHALPYADGFFEAIMSVNSYWFFGTGDFYFHNYFTRLVKPGGQIGMVVPGVVQEMEGEVPEHLRPHWDADFYGWHSPDWWRRHWERTGMVEVEVADHLDGDDGWRLMERWQEAIDRVGLARDDQGRCIRFVRVVARRKGEG